MSNASKLRAFAISVEAVVRMMPTFVQRKALTRSEGEHLVRQLKSGAEVALTIATDMQTKVTNTAAHDALMRCRWCDKVHGGGPENCAQAELLAATKALLPVLIALRHTVGLGKTQMERIERAQRAVHAAESAAAVSPSQ